MIERNYSARTSMKNRSKKQRKIVRGMKRNPQIHEYARPPTVNYEALRVCVKAGVLLQSALL